MHSCVHHQVVQSALDAALEATQSGVMRGVVTQDNINLRQQPSDVRTAIVSMQV
jgi:hypothetical protein